MNRQQHGIRYVEKFFETSSEISPAPHIKINPAKTLARGGSFAV